MKLVIAVISPDKLDSVRASLPEPDAYIYYVNHVGDVRDPIRSSYRGGNSLEPRPRLRVEIIVVNEMLYDEVIRKVVAAASPENGEWSGGGNVFVLPLEDWIRIPDGESTRSVQVDKKDRVY